MKAAYRSGIPALSDVVTKAGIKPV